MKTVRILIFVAILMAMLALPILASAKMLMAPQAQGVTGDITDLPSFFYWVIYSGGALIIASYLLEKWKWFLGLSVNWKKVLNFTFAAIIAVIFYAVLTFVSPDILAKIDPFFKIILGFIVAFGAQQTFHAITKADG